MKVLISNDDGIEASGIQFLAKHLAAKHEVTVVAPDKERSSCGHGITLGDPIRVKAKKKNWYACSGLPADCILVALGHFFKETKPDVILSGINHGANLGQDRYYSGTVAAAREGAFRGVPSIAISLVTKGIKDLEHFETASYFIGLLLENHISSFIPSFHVLNINIPNLAQADIAGFKFTTSGRQLYSEEVIERQDTRGRSYFWVGGTYQGFEELEGSDCEAVNQGWISLDLQNLNSREVTDDADIEKLKRLLSKLN